MLMKKVKKKSRAVSGRLAFDSPGQTAHFFPLLYIRHLDGVEERSIDRIDINKNIRRSDSNTLTYNNVSESEKKIEKK